MAFWKKSDDPWDRKPGKKTETAWWEQEPVGAGHPAGLDTASPEAGGAAGADNVDAGVPTGASETTKLTAEERIRRIIEGPQPTPYIPEPCPWCGGEMKRVYLWSKGFIRWSDKLPSGFMEDYEVLDDPPESIWDSSYKQGSYCEACEKMTLNVKKPRRAQVYHDTNSFADYARQWKEMEEREKEEKRRKKEER